MPLIWENDETCMKGKIRTVFRMITHWTTLVTSTGLCPINCLSLLCFLLFSSPVVCQMSNKEPWLFGLHGGLYYPIIFVEWNQPLWGFLWLERNKGLFHYSTETEQLHLLRLEDLQWKAHPSITRAQRMRGDWSGQMATVWPLLSREQWSIPWLYRWCRRLFTMYMIYSVIWALLSNHTL